MESGGVASQRPEAWFVIDDHQRIVEWSYSASMTLAVPEEAALGRPCYEVVQGYDAFGRAVCQPDCPAFQELRSGRSTRRYSLLVDLPSGRRARFSANLVALPSVSGGALAHLVERGLEPLATASNLEAPAEPHSSWVPSPSIIEDLASVASLSTSLAADRLQQSLDHALDWLRQTLGAEAAELFLAEPGGGDMLLTAYRGPFEGAFSQITRFHPGEGFPGLVLSSAEPIVTWNLPTDARYLRTRVKEKGFHFYVCVPLLSATGVSGSLHVASRPDLDIDRALRLLTWASHPISTVLEAGLLRNRRVVEAHPMRVPEDVGGDFTDLLHDLLRQMMLVGDATSGAMFLYDRSLGGVVRRVTEGEFAGGVCPHLSAGSSQACPALSGGHGMALYGPRYQWPVPCRQASAGGSVLYCLPLVAEGEELGIVQMRYAGGAPSPPTKHLPALLSMAEESARMTRWAWRAQRTQERTLVLLRDGKGELSRGAAGVEGPPSQSLSEAGTSAERSVRPFLEMHCFGPFELYREGRLVAPETFGRRGALTLLKILVAHPGRPISRDALVELLWPEADSQAAMRRLYVLVHALRRVVEPAKGDRRWVFICSEGDLYFFNSHAPYRSDVEEFGDYVRSGRKLEGEGKVGQALEAYEAAVSLYRGDFLEEEPYAEWCWAQREELRQSYLDLLGRLAALYLEHNAPQKSVELYQRAVRAEPLREEMHRGLMRALWLTGRRSEALHQYQTCRDILLKELEVPPEPETERLYRLIREGHAR